MAQKGLNTSTLFVHASPVSIIAPLRLIGRRMPSGSNLFFSMDRQLTMNIRLNRAGFTDRIQTLGCAGIPDRRHAADESRPAAKGGGSRRDENTAARQEGDVHDR